MYIKLSWIFFILFRCFLSDIPKENITMINKGHTWKGKTKIKVYTWVEQYDSARQINIIVSGYKPSHC